MKQICFLSFIWLLVPINYAQIVHLKENAVVVGFNVLLSDIAIVTDYKKLGKIVVTKAPLPGKTQIYEREHIAQELAKQGFSNIFWKGAQSIRITTKKMIIYPKDLEPLALEYTSAFIAKKNSDFLLNLISSPKNPIVLPAPRANLKMDYGSLKTSKRGKQITVKIILSVDQKILRKVPFVFSVRLFARVVITCCPIAARTRLLPTHLKYKRMEVTSIQPITSLTTALASHTRYTLSAGHALQQRDIEKYPVIKRGDTVFLSLNSGNLSVKLKVKALEKGYKKDIIRVINLSSRRVLKAKIANKNLVILAKER